MVGGAERRGRERVERMEDTNLQLRTRQFDTSKESSVDIWRRNLERTKMAFLPLQRSDSFLRYLHPCCLLEEDAILVSCYYMMIFMKSARGVWSCKHHAQGTEQIQFPGRTSADCAPFLQVKVSANHCTDTHCQLQFIGRCGMY